MPEGENQYTRDERPWTNRDLMKELYIDEGRSTRDIAGEFGCSQGVISKWIRRHDLKREYPWRDKRRLKELYHERGLSLREIGAKLECDASTVNSWMGRHGIETRKSNKEKPPTYVNDDGYQVWWAYNGDSYKHVRVHRLLAVAEYGFEAVCDNHIHHKNHIPWDNRPENIEVMSPSEHMKHHASE